jgi:hypothetical protein
MGHEGPEGASTTAERGQLIRQLLISIERQGGAWDQATHNSGT